MARSAGAVAAMALALVVASASAAPPAFPTLIPAGPRDPANPQIAMCVCVDEGINTDACITAVKTYCLGKEPDGKICTFFRGLVNNGNKELGQMAGGFLAKTCGVKVPLSSNACACLQGASTPGCRAAALNACLLGNSLCQSTIFGPKAIEMSRDSLKGFVKGYCPKAEGITNAVLNFTGLSKADFASKYAAPISTALAGLAKVPATAVGAPTTKAIGADLSATFPITSLGTDIPAITENLNAAAANGGVGLHSALATAGVPLKPSFAVTGPPGYEVARRIDFEVSKAEAAGAKDVAANLTAVQAEFKETPVAVPPPAAAATPAPAPAPAPSAAASATGPAAVGAAAAATAASKAADKGSGGVGAPIPVPPAGPKVPAGQASRLSDGETAGVVVGSIAGASLLGAGALALSRKKEGGEGTEERAAIVKDNVSSSAEEASTRAKTAAADVEKAAAEAVERR